MTTWTHPLSGRWQWTLNLYPALTTTDAALVAAVAAGDVPAALCGRVSIDRAGATPAVRLPDSVLMDEPQARECVAWLDRIGVGQTRNGLRVGWREARTGHGNRALRFVRADETGYGHVMEV